MHAHVSAIPRDALELTAEHTQPIVLGAVEAFEGAPWSPGTRKLARDPVEYYVERVDERAVTQQQTPRARAARFAVHDVAVVEQLQKARATSSLESVSSRALDVARDALGVPALGLVVALGLFGSLVRRIQQQLGQAQRGLAWAERSEREHGRVTRHDFGPPGGEYGFFGRPQVGHAHRLRAQQRSGWRAGRQGDQRRKRTQ